MYADDELVVLALHSGVPENLVVGSLKVNDDLGDLCGHALGGSHIERHPGPSPVIHIELQGRIGLGFRIRVHPGFFPVSYHGLPVAATGKVLPTDGVFEKDLRISHDP